MLYSFLGAVNVFTLPHDTGTHIHKTCSWRNTKLGVKVKTSENLHFVFNTDMVKHDIRHHFNY